MNKIKIFELFTGIGANSKALSNLGIDYEIVGYSEIDEHASKSFASIHGVSEELNFGDITKLDKLPCEIDLLTGGFPCQPFSGAGKGLGITDNRGLLVMDMVRIAKHNKPKVIVAENVKGLLNTKNKPLLDLYISELEKLGYTTEYRLLNSKDFGVPQNRERVFIVSVLEQCFDIKFPEKQEYKPALRDILENEVDDWYHFSQEALKRMDVWKSYQNPLDKVLSPEDICPTITTRIAISDGGGINASTKIIDLHAKETKKLRHGKFEGKTLRFLTPLECWRLMGFDDEAFDKAWVVSEGTMNKRRGHMYKQAGNSIVVQVLEAIYKELYGGING